jgi:hypothetical protein
MRRLLFVLGIALGAIGLGRGIDTAHAATLVVCKHGCPYSSIQAAINAAASGDTIQVRRGTYFERVEITKNVALVGAGARDTTIRHPGTIKFVPPGVSANINALGVFGGGPGIVNAGVLVAVNVEVSEGNPNFTFKGGGIVNDGNLTLVNSTVRNNQAERFGGGIFNEDGARLTLQGSTVHNNRVLSPRGDGGGIYNDSERGDVRLEQGSSVTGNHPNNCVNVTGCSSSTLPSGPVPPNPLPFPVLPDLWCSLPGVPAFLC